MYKNLTLSLCGRDIVSDRPSTQEFFFFFFLKKAMPKVLLLLLYAENIEEEKY